MPLWDKVRQEFDKAGSAARELLDEGKLRLDAYRARERADDAASALGYAWFRAGQPEGGVPPDVRERLWNALALHDAEARRLEAQLEAVRRGGPASDPQPPAGPEGQTDGRARPEPSPTV